jgi:hypothetical protein
MRSKGNFMFQILFLSRKIPKQQKYEETYCKTLFPFLLILNSCKKDLLKSLYFFESPHKDALEEVFLSDLKQKESNLFLMKRGTNKAKEHSKFPFAV